LQEAQELKDHGFYDPKMNDTELGTKYLNFLLSYCDNTTNAIAAYNAGYPTVNKTGGVPNIQETKDYVKKIDKCLKDKGIAKGIKDKADAGGCNCNQK
jgi:hypothetical protein